MAKRAGMLCAGLVLLFGTRSTAAAQTAHRGSDLGVALRLGTVGAGLEFSKWLAGHLGARVGLNFFSKSFNDREVDGNQYDARLKVHALMALLDLYPGARGAFHFTAGLSTNPARLTATGTPTSGTFEFNSHTYNSNEVGVLTGEAKFNKLSPYAGLGFGTAARGGRLAFVVDLGVAFGKPKISLTASGAAGNPQLQSDLNAEIADVQEDADKLPGYPVISLGLMYRF